MKNNMLNKSTLARAKQLNDIVSKYYERENQSKCKMQVYRTFVKEQYAISERTFFRMLRIARENNL